MDVEYLLGSVLQGVLTSRGRRKPVKGALRYVLGNRRLVGAGAVVLGGLALEFLESWRKGSAVAAGAPFGGASAAPPASATPAAGAVLPPPLPGGVTRPPVAATPPPLPPGHAKAAPPAGRLQAGGAGAGAGASPDAQAAEVPAAVARVIRLSLSAARADGALTPFEQDAILTQARAVGAEALVARDLREPRALGDIVHGVEAPRERQQLYSIAFAIIRADGEVTDKERLYLRSLAAHLGLDEEIIAELEREAAAGIRDAATDPAAPA